MLSNFLKSQKCYSLCVGSGILFVTYFLSFLLVYVVGLWGILIGLILSIFLGIPFLHKTNGGLPAMVLIGVTGIACASLFLFEVAPWQSIRYVEAFSIGTPIIETVRPQASSRAKTVVFIPLRDTQQNTFWLRKEYTGKVSVSVDAVHKGNYVEFVPGVQKSMIQKFNLQTDGYENISVGTFVGDLELLKEKKQSSMTVYILLVGWLLFVILHFIKRK